MQTAKCLVLSLDFGVRNEVNLYKMCVPQLVGQRVHSQYSFCWLDNCRNIVVAFGYVYILPKKQYIDLIYVSES